MSNKVSVSVPHTGFLGLLTIVFVVLKLTGFIDWTWLWVTSPLWMGAAIVLALLFFLLLLRD